jgi:hypothetical protein
VRQARGGKLHWPPPTSHARGDKETPTWGVITGGGGEAVATMESAVTAVTGSLVGACETGTGFLG